MRRVLLPLLAAGLLLGPASAGLEPPEAVAASTGAAATSAGTPHVVAERRISAHVRDLVIWSPAMGSKQTVRILVPHGWKRDADRTWPVLWLLHGCCEKVGYTSWTRNTDVERLTRDVPAIVVMPPGGWDGFYSDWLDHGQGEPPRWERFHLTELRRLLEAHYGAGRSRAIAGLSMGGFGALSYAARHPRMFRSAASFSGVAHTTYSPPVGSSLVQGLLVSGGHDPTGLWGDPRLDADVWAAHNPFDLAGRLTDIPVYLSCGTGEAGPYDDPTGSDPALEATLYRENVALTRRLRRLDADVRTHLGYPGTHTWPYWQRELHRAFPMLMRSIGVTR